MTTAQQTSIRRGVHILLCVTAIAALAGCSWLQNLTATDATQAQPQPGASQAPAPAASPITGQPIPDTVATILPAGSGIRAHTNAGYIQVNAGPGSLRTITWGENRYRVATRPRAEPFPGAETVGLSYEGKLPGRQARRNGVNKLHYEENSRNFEVPYAMRVWTQIRRLDFSYNNNGLAVGWRRKGDTLYVEVWQFRIADKIPQELPGANDAAISFMAPTTPAEAAAPVGKAAG